MKNKLLQIAIIIALLAVLFSCEKEPEFKIALSKSDTTKHYVQYKKWLEKINAEIECVNLYHLDSAEAQKRLLECSGLILTGGPDVAPSYYGKTEDSARCQIDFRRDTLEFDLIETAYRLDMPILGICRGQQILNVSFGGSLIVDIPSDFDTTVAHRCEDSENCFHKIMTVEGSKLRKICQSDYGLVNTNHHQGIDRLAKAFKASAFSKDGLIEAIEWKNPKEKQYLIAVQWHPERMDFDSDFSKPIGYSFIEAARKYYLNDIK